MASRSIFSQFPPKALLSAESVRRSAALPREGSLSGQSKVARLSRCFGPPSIARYAKRAIALRVSTSIGAPSSTIWGGPSNEISSRGKVFSRGNFYTNWINFAL